MKALYNHDPDRGFPEIVSAWIEAGADIETRIGCGAKNEGGRTALMMVRDKDHVEVINQLHEAELELNDDLSCGSRTPPGVNVVTSMKNPDH